MRLLWLGTKNPWPPKDGGRVAAAYTIEALVAAGHDVTFLGPVECAESSHLPEPPGVRVIPIPARRRPFARAVACGFASGRPTSIARHDHPDVTCEVTRLLRSEHFDCVHVEQVQALAHAEPALAADIPTVLRCQNVESDLWRGAARWAGLLAPLLRLEAYRMARFESWALRRVSEAVALTKPDAEALSRLSGRKVRVIAVPFPSRLEPAATRLDGNPPVVLLGDSLWRPNAQAARWFVSAVWSQVIERLPAARLHAFGQRPAWTHPSICWVSSPEDSRTAFPAGSILAVPLFVGSGVRIKILEAWARGIPVVASPAAVSGLDATDGQELLEASDPAAFTRAIVRYHSSPGLVERTTETGAARLALSHDPGRVAALLSTVYEDALGRKTKSSLSG